MFLKETRFASRKMKGRLQLKTKQNPRAKAEGMSRMGLGIHASPSIAGSSSVAVATDGVFCSSESGLGRQKSACIGIPAVKSGF